MAKLRDVQAESKGVRGRVARTGGRRQSAAVPRWWWGLRKWVRALVAAALAAVMVFMAAPVAMSVTATDGWYDGANRKVGVGRGLVLSNFFNVGSSAAWRQKWLGALDASIVSNNVPTDELWCIEAGADVLSGHAYGWTGDSNVKARYLLWLADHTWNTPDGRAAIQYLLYADVYPQLGRNNDGTTGDYESRIYNHSEFTQGAKDYVAAFRMLPESWMHNTQADLAAHLTQANGSRGTLDGIGVREGWGNYVPNLPYTITINGPAVFDSTGTNTVSGTTSAFEINGAHSWTATGNGTVGFTINYPGANMGWRVYRASSSAAQDMIGYAEPGDLVSQDPVVPVALMFQPGGDTQVPSAQAAAGSILRDTFVPSAVNGTTWPIDTSTGAYVPATFTWTVYDTNGSIPTSSTSAPPASWTALETIQVVATRPGVAISSNFTTRAQAGHSYAFVVSFIEAAQPVATRGWFVGDWNDAAGLIDEVVVSPAIVTPSTRAIMATRSGNPVILDQVSMTGFPANHGSFGGVGPFGPDNPFVQQRLYFFPRGVPVTDANLSSATLRCDLRLRAVNGSQSVDEACGVALRDGFGQLRAGTYVWTTSFAGDARTAPFSTSVTDVREQVVIAPTFQPGGVTSVPAAVVAPGSVLADTFTPNAVAGTSWGIEDGRPVPVTFDWTVYDTGGVIPTSSTSTPPASWTALETIQVTTSTAGVPIASTFTTQAQAGHTYAFVVSFRVAAQPAATRGWFTADWADAAGAQGEVVSSPAVVTPSSIASSEQRTGGVVVLDQVTFTGFPADHGAFAGANGIPADVATVAQRLYFFPEGLAVTDANIADAELLCDLTVPATNGTHTVDNPCATVKTDAFDQEVAGTYAWASTFTGDGRAAAFTTSVTDTAEQVTIVNTPRTVTTIARQTSAGTMTDGASIIVWDTTRISGYVPVGSTLGYALYKFDSLTSPRCDADTLITKLAPEQAITGPGDYTSTRYTLTVPDAAGVGFVETLYGPTGDVLSVGECGTRTETLPIMRAGDTGDDTTRDLARTGAQIAGTVALAGVTLALGGALVAIAWVGRRRRDA